MRSLILLIFITLASSLYSQLSAQEIQKRPNILFAISDDQSYPHAGAYGDQGVKTPAFDRVAKERGTLSYLFGRFSRNAAPHALHF